MGLKIYLSSTFEDLKDYRRRVYEQLRTLRHDVIAMEDYVAADERPLDKCLRDVRDSDVYIGLFAWRYGYAGCWAVRLALAGWMILRFRRKGWLGRAAAEQEEPPRDPPPGPGRTEEQKDG